MKDFRVAKGCSYTAECKIAACYNRQIFAIPNYLIYKHTDSILWNIQHILHLLKGTDCIASIKHTIFVFIYIYIVNCCTY